VKKLRTILALAGNSYKIHDPETWPRQARLAHQGKWDELLAWQEKLNGGVEKTEVAQNSDDSVFAPGNETEVIRTGKDGKPRVTRKASRAKGKANLNTSNSKLKAGVSVSALDELKKKIYKLKQSQDKN